MTCGGGARRGAVVVALEVVEPGDREPVAIGLVGEGDPVVGAGQELAQRAERRPVDVVAHVLAQHVTPVALGDDVLGVGDRQRRHALDREPAPVVLGRIGLVERSVETSGGGAL